VQVEEAAAALDELDHGALLLGRHPDVILLTGGLRSLQAIAQNHEQPHTGEILGR
jgi:hypothetical protein